MDVEEAIRTRRSVGQFRLERPPAAMIERLIEAAMLAPNRYLTEPWRFCVLAGEARAALGRLCAAKVRSMLVEPLTSADEQRLATEEARPLGAPVIVAVAVKRGDHPRAIWLEEIAAVAAAIENLLLLAHAEGLGAKWRTGVAAYDADVKRFLGFSAEDHLAGLIYLGYPAALPTETGRRTGAAGKIVWKGWDESGRTGGAR